MPCGLGEEKILNHQVLEPGEPLAGMRRIGIGHGRVLPHDVEATDRAGVNGVHDLDDRQPALVCQRPAP